VTENTVKVYHTNISNLNIKCTLSYLEDSNPKINVESFNVLNSANSPKIEISYFKEQVRDLVLFLQKIIEAHDAATKDQ
jgi:hypothetical protein